MQMEHVRDPSKCRFRPEVLGLALSISVPCYFSPIYPLRGECLGVSSPHVCLYCCAQANLRWRTRRAVDGRERNAFQLDSEAEACDECRETGTPVARRIKSTNLLRNNVPRGSVARTTLSIARLVAGDVERRMAPPRGSQCWRRAAVVFSPSEECTYSGDVYAQKIAQSPVALTCSDAFRIQSGATTGAAATGCRWRRVDVVDLRVWHVHGKAQTPA